MNPLSSSRRAGFALVIVLSILVLVAALAVGFLVRTSVERTSASSYNAAARARQLADTAVGLVQGQINIATGQGAGVAWATQPGMVRTFGLNGNLERAYKLYSGPNMIADTVDLTADLPPASWAGDSALWTDLNAPVQVSGTNVYPILAPMGAGQPEGYAIDAGNAAGAAAAGTPYMPVRWLYVLRNGEIIAPTGSGVTAAVPGETAANPIVGRIAFWTDDETCKVNINTAGEGDYWDTPRANTQYDHDHLANYQPAQREWQRYPGHPAMTSLSSAFPFLNADQIYAIVPRVVGGGSDRGTQLATGPLTPDTDRLYASVDELLFDPARTPNGGLDQAQVGKARFFVTAHSRAPETNLFNLPRIACWPIFKDAPASKVTVFDRMIALCASTGTGANLLPYYFQRENPDSVSHDIGLARNLQLYQYLQYLTSRPVPGFGGDFLAKYGDDRDQILTEIFDYIRCTNLYDEGLAAGGQFTKSYHPEDPIDSVNATSPGHGWVAPTVNTQSGQTTMGFGRSYTISEMAIGFICNAAPDAAGTAFPSNVIGSGTDPYRNEVLGGVRLQPDEKYIQAILIPEFFSPMLGWRGLHPNMDVEISGLRSLSVTCGGATQSLFDIDEEKMPLTGRSQGINGGHYWGGNPAWRYALAGRGSPGRGNLASDENTFDPYPFVGLPVKIHAPPTGGTMTFDGGTIVVRLYAHVTGDLIQTLHLTFPPTTVPVPDLVTSGLASTKYSPATEPPDWWAFSRRGEIASGQGYSHKGRFNYVARVESENDPGCFFRPDFDVVRSILPKHGDYRLIAASYNAGDQPGDNPHTDFAAQKDYGKGASVRVASSLANYLGGGAAVGFDADGKYVAAPSVHFPPGYEPDMPSDATATPAATGDYDNTIPNAADGPFINKPDEGNNYRLAAGDVPYFTNAGKGTLSGVFFSPNRQIPSPGMFGSLPSGIKAGVPWRTLLFRPQGGHFGASAPADHLWLDLFWMPVVEPYAISDRFSTAGKINMNYQILPFTYIRRATGMYALLKAEKVAAIPNSAAGTYKKTTLQTPNIRLAIDADQTLSQFDSLFSQGKIFRSASQICDEHIVPAGQTLATMNGSFWNSNSLTGDNLRERIYTTLYPRLTTKSNTFTIHVRVQALKKSPASSPGTWREGKDQVVGEYRGATTVERFIDANNPAIPDYAANPADLANFETLDKFYQWRVIANHQFAP